MMLVDSHCHLDQLDLTSYQGDLDAAISAARDDGVGYFLCVCIDLENFPTILNISLQHPDIAVSVGLHPNEQVGEEPSVDTLIELAKPSKVVAIGESGLDYYRGQGDLTWQRNRFRNHIIAAKHCKKPLIIHTRDAREDTLAIMREEDAAAVGGVMHCFTENWEMAKQALDLGFYISFSGIITFKNAQELQSVAKKVPLDRILIETDSPYLAPVPFRGKPNEPKWVKCVAQCIADLRGTSLTEVAEATTDNFFNLFRIQRP